MNRKYRLILIYATVLAAAVFVLETIDYRHSIRKLSTEVFIFLIALGFTVLGIWMGNRMTSPAEGNKRAQSIDASDAAASAAGLGISQREFEVLTLIAGGQSNKEIARTLAISPNTVKTHVSRLYEKLNVASRTQAVKKARHHQLI